MRNRTELVSAASADAEDRIVAAVKYRFHRAATAEHYDNVNFYEASCRVGARTI